MKTMPAALTLIDGDTALPIRTRNPHISDPIICSRWDLGAPDIRDSSAPNQSADGTTDTSQYTGARTVTLDLSIMGDTFTGGPDDFTKRTAYDYADQLAAMTHPLKRPVLRIVRPNVYGEWEQWEIGLRGNPFSLAYDRAAAGRLQMQLTFTAPLGYLEGPWRGLDSSVVGDQNIVDISFPIVFPFSTGSGFARVPERHFTLTGSAPISPVIYLYGPSTNPYVTTEQGERFAFTGLTLQAGQFVQVDMDAGTALLDGSPSASVYQFINFDQSTFWRWSPGPHTVRYHANGGFFKVQYRERRLTI